MTPLVIAVAACNFALLAIWTAIKAHTAELRAIAEQEAEERRNRGLDANIAARWQG